ncbi:MAG TPA: hypothetical protein VMI54_25975 [Polyangiaceae bacterium]|nr:hypothetical protein [Polyangiaceae bacterium]
MRTIFYGCLLAVGATWPAPAFAEPPATVGRGEELGRTGDASVSVGVLREQGDVRSETAGFVSVEFPFERLAAPRPLLLALADDPAESAENPPYDEPAPADAGGPSADDDAYGTVAPALDAEVIGRLAREAVARAESVHGLAAHERALDGAAARARASAALPEVRLRAARSRDEALRLSPTASDPYQFSLAGGTGTLLEAQATFRLNRLVFADEEVPLERVRLERERMNERLEARVTAAVVAWHKALSREFSALDADARGRAALARVGAEIALDVLTDGWFGARVRRLPLPRVERREPGPKIPAAPQPASKNPSQTEGSAVAHLEERSVSATSRAPCLRMLATDSKTFCGASMR